jgi:hypothetical protein
MAKLECPAQFRLVQMVDSSKNPNLSDATGNSKVYVTAEFFNLKAVRRVLLIGRLVIINLQLFV